MRRLVSTLAACMLALTAVPARADQVRFTGRTTVDDIVIRDALQTILRAAVAAHHCNVLTSVEASVLPPGWAPPNANDRIGPAETRYERWNVTMCGRVEPFLLGFWGASGGGTMFQVHYPFPAVEPATPA